MTETTINVTTNESEELRIPAYQEHLWLRCPKTLREHFDNVRKGIFEISPPCFEWKVSDYKIEFMFKWGTDLLHLDTPLNTAGVEEHLWVKSIRGLKYIHPSREFNKIMKHGYPGLWMEQHFAHDWNDDGDVITLIISWDLTKYEPKTNEENTTT